jgi:hypothetical protein
MMKADHGQRLFLRHHHRLVPGDLGFDEIV